MQESYILFYEKKIVIYILHKSTSEYKERRAQGYRYRDRMFIDVNPNQHICRLRGYDWSKQSIN